jgi:hypothetical protein
VSVCVLSAVPSVANAQAEQPALELRGAFGLSRYLHGDLGYSTPAWLAAIRVGRGPVVVEGEFASAHHEERQVFGPPAAETVTISRDTFRSAAANLLGRWGRRTTAFAGGGPGLYWERSEYRLEAATGGYQQKTTRGPRLGAQVVAGVDVPLASRIKAFGQFRYEVRSFEDPGGGSVVQGFGGVAIALR